MKQYIKDLKVIYSRELDDGFFDGKLAKASHDDYLSSHHDKVPHLAHADYLEENNLPLIAQHIRDTVNNLPEHPVSTDDYGVDKGVYPTFANPSKINVEFYPHTYTNRPHAVVVYHSKPLKDQPELSHIFSYRKNFKDENEAINYRNALNEELNNADNS
jgi:hypothetical protein